MAKKQPEKKKKPDPERQMALESLPPTIKESLTDEEVELFLYAEEWPESLLKKWTSLLSNRKKSRCMNELVLINITGKDRKGLIAKFTKVLARHNTNILDIGRPSYTTT